MNEYYNFNNFNNINNNESDELDKLARQINNKKTSLVKKVTDDYNTQQNKWKNGIDNLINNNKYSFLSMNKNNPTNYDNKYQNLNKSYDGYDNSDDNFDEISINNSLFSSDLIDSELINSELIDSESIDLYLDKVKDKKNNLKSFKNIVNSISYDECSKDDNNIFDHIKKCQNCKNKLIKYLNIPINNEIKNNKIENNDNKLFNFKLNKLEQLSVKEIIVIIMIGIFIIIVLDLLFGIKKNKFL
jgi:hypothetical protein